MLVGILVCSPISGAMAVLGSGVAVALGVALGINPNTIYAGLVGFNPALVAISVGGFFFVFNSWQVNCLFLALSLFGVSAMRARTLNSHYFNVLLCAHSFTVLTDVFVPPVL